MNKEFNNILEHIGKNLSSGFSAGMENKIDLKNDFAKALEVL